MLTKPGNRLRQSLPQWDACRPTKLAQLRDIGELLRRAVRQRFVENNLAAKTRNLRNRRGNLFDGQVLSGSDIERALAREMLHHIDQCIGTVVHMEEFAARP